MKDNFGINICKSNCANFSSKCDKPCVVCDKFQPTNKAYEKRIIALTKELYKYKPIKEHKIIKEFQKVIYEDC
jgi:hypothetical protein